MSQTNRSSRMCRCPVSRPARPLRWPGSPTGLELQGLQAIVQACPRRRGAGQELLTAIKSAPLRPRPSQRLEMSVNVPFDRIRPPSDPSKNWFGLFGLKANACWSGCRPSCEASVPTGIVGHIRKRIAAIGGHKKPAGIGEPVILIIVIRSLHEYGVRHDLRGWRRAGRTSIGQCKSSTLRNQGQQRSCSSSARSSGYRTRPHRQQRIG